MEPVNRRYTNEEVSAIVRRALSGSGAGDTIGYEDLEEIARQAGISPRSLELAIDQQETEGELDAARDQWRKKEKSDFFGHLRAYLIVNGMLLIMNLLTSPGYIWVMWPMLGWGIGLAFHASAAFWPGEDSVEKGARRILRRRQRQRRRHEERYDEV